MRRIKLFVLLLICMSMAGCGTLGQVQAWEKGKLARQDMKFERDLLDAKYVDHTYFSKEAATGGTSVGGGGCGCN